MKFLLLLSISFTFALSAPADGIEKHVPEKKEVQALPLPSEDDNTESSPGPDPYPKYVDVTQNKAQTKDLRLPTSSTQPLRYVDNEFGVACYYILPPQFPGVASVAAASISCVQINNKNTTTPPTPSSPTNEGN